jgi:ketosteroid isomerase-like protein
MRLQKSSTLVIAIVVLLLTPVIANAWACCSSPTAFGMVQSVPDAEELTKLLNEFLAGASRNDPAIHDRFWAEDLIYTRSAGRRVTKADIMRDLKSAPAPQPDDPKTVYTAEDIRIQQYGDTAVVAFRLVATTEIDGRKQVQHLLNSGTFLKREGKWQVVNWQSTRMSRTEQENKADVAAAAASFRQALLSGDVKKFTDVTDESFVWSQGKGKESTRKQLLDGLKAVRMELPKPDTPKETISLYGDTAVVRGEAANGRYTMTLVNQGGAWKIVALHSSN